MLFNSLEYLIFFPVVFILYWSVKSNRINWQNIILTVASYIFYACWDYRFLFLLIFSTALGFFTGREIFYAKSQSDKKKWLFASIVINIGLLGFFKYYNFFIDSFSELLALLGFSPNIWTLKIILPVGISFYTFHGLSYILDIYNNKIKPSTNFIDYSLFVSFFPLLVAGPIERATHLLPQLQHSREFSYEKATDGLKQILWGLFKKVVVADNCAVVVNNIFDNYETMPAWSLIIGALFFALQIYGDFSGYSDMALGSARLLGIELLKNFSYPYFSRDIAEFWRRWHMYLTTWFRDYLYIPLGGSRTTKIKIIRNTFVIFLVSGFWHGANYTFIVWGLFHAVLFMPLLLFGKNRSNTNTVACGKRIPSIKELFGISITFTLVTIGWIIFRADSIHAAFGYVKNIFSSTILNMPETEGFLRNIFFVALTAPILVLTEWRNREESHGLKNAFSNVILRWSLYVLLIVCIVEVGGGQQEFIYFQF
jgi:D-alanyl-lipoteichoic acid acyltransferase DltB (MBOAT superfamily)